MKKNFRFCILFVLIFLFNTLIAKAEREVKKEDIELKNGIIYFKGEENSYNGIVKENYPNGKLKENFYELIDFEKNLDIIQILRKCLENKFLVFIDNEDFFETKIGIVTDLEKNKIKMKEIGKYGNFHKNSEIYFDEIQLLAVKNYKLGV